MPAETLPRELHGVLLRLAGWAPDEMLAAARRWLAQGNHTEVARAAAYVARAQRVPIQLSDAMALLSTLAESEPGLTMAQFHVVEALEMPWFLMTANRPGGESADDLDERAKRAVAGPGIGGQPETMWRTWRLPATPTGWPAPCRLYLVQVGSGPQEPVAVANGLQQALRGVETPDPVVEAFTADDVLPPYHRAALAHATRLWSARPVKPLRIAAVFDPMGTAGGPGFAGTRAGLNRTETAQVAAYLDAAPAVVMTTATMDDVMAPERGASVPMSFRTDGLWIWSDAVSYYLREHGVAPETELLGHIRDQGYEPGERVDRNVLYQALLQLQTTADGEA